MCTFLVIDCIQAEIFRQDFEHLKTELGFILCLFNRIFFLECLYQFFTWMQKKRSLLPTLTPESISDPWTYMTLAPVPTQTTRKNTPLAPDSDWKTKKIRLRLPTPTPTIKHIQISLWLRLWFLNIFDFDSNSESESLILLPTATR